MVCDDAQLAALDRQLAGDYQKALARAGADIATMQALQKGWMSGRDDCWKADDVRRCVLESYQTRIVELKAADPAVRTAIVFAEQSGSGARYVRDGVEFWEHQGEVTVDFFGNKFACTTS